MNNWRAKLLVFLMTAVVGWWLKERFFVTEESRVRRRIEALEEAVERGQFLKLTTSISRDYSDDRGLDRGSLLAAIRAFRMQRRSFFIHISNLSIRVEPSGERAEATLLAKVVAHGGSETEIHAERLRLKFRKEEGAWLLVGAEAPKLNFE